MVLHIRKEEKKVSQEEKKYMLDKLKKYEQLILAELETKDKKSGESDEE